MARSMRFFKGKRRLIAEHTACLFDRVVEMQAEELEAGLVDERRILGAAELGDRPRPCWRASAPARSGMCRVGGLSPASSATRADELPSW